MFTNFVEVIKACERAEGAGSKNVIKEALSRADKPAQGLIAEAQNVYRVFGVKKFERPSRYAESDGQISVVFETLDELASRKLTGTAAQEAVTWMLSCFTEETASYLERIIDKDLGAGFSRDTVNKIFPGLIPTFEVMLADKCDSPEEFEKYVKMPCCAEFKKDGNRLIAIVKENEVTYYSRSGKESSHLNGLFDEELLRIREYLTVDFVIDGESFASNFTETMNAKKAGNDEAKNNLRLYAFFLMPLSDWVAQRTENTMRSTRRALERILKTCNCEKIILVEGREVTDYQDMINFCNEAIDVHNVEGLILKDWDATYKWDRSLAWCKVKRMYDADCRIVGFYPGRPKSRLENTLGGLIVAGFLENGTRVECNVGSGFSDDLRAEIWNNKEEYLGKTAVIKYQEVSKAKGKEVASLRFPVYMHVRDDKIVEI